MINNPAFHFLQTASNTFVNKPERDRSYNAEYKKLRHTAWLKNILEITAIGDVVKAYSFANKLDVSAPTVRMLLRELVSQGYFEVDKISCKTAHLYKRVK